MRYLVVIEKAKRNYAAYVPDLPGCIATGPTPGATRKAIRQAIEFHIEGMKEDGVAVPKPSAKSAEISITAARKRRTAA